MPAKPPDTCGTCKNWLRDGKAATGHCHQAAPALNLELARVLCGNTLVADMAHWPRTKETDWCGEHKP